MPVKSILNVSVKSINEKRDLSEDDNNRYEEQHKRQSETSEISVMKSDGERYTLKANGFETSEP